MANAEVDTGPGAVPVLDRFRLTDRVAVITGAGKGIGAAIAVAVAEAGGHVALMARTGRDLDAVAGAVESRGGRALVFPADVNDLDVLPRFLEATVATFGGVDIVVNNAGGSQSFPSRSRCSRRGSSTSNGPFTSTSR
jgi:7-alpha-hydroxysteroid dehydrogenase